jgi:hypothetical protein
VKLPDGSTLNITGADFSYGVGTSIDEAELNLRNHKAKREGIGEIARGELRGIAATIENPRIPIPRREPLLPDCVDTP